MKRVKQLVASDNDLSIKINISITGKGLTRHEMDNALHAVASYCMKAIGEAPYISIWPSQIKIK